MNADEHADLRSVLEQIPLHCMVGTGEVMTGGVSALLLIVPLFKSGTCAMLVQCGALVEQVRFILPEDLFYFFCIKCATQQLHDKAFLYTNHKS